MPGFSERFLKRCSVCDLVQLSHELRIHPEDRDYLHSVLGELRVRELEMRQEQEVTDARRA